MISTDTCIHCKYCTQSFVGRPPSTGRPCLQPPLPKKFKTSKSPADFKLFRILRDITPKALWKKISRRPGRPKGTLNTLPLPPKKHPGWKAINESKMLKLRREMKPEEVLISVSPRISTAAHFGPNVLARSYFPDVLEAPQPTLSPEEALRLTISQQSNRLSNTNNLSIGCKNGDALRPAAERMQKYADNLSESEPLRAMAMKGVTNLADLELLSALLEEDI